MEKWSEGEKESTSHEDVEKKGGDVKCRQKGKGALVNGCTSINILIFISKFKYEPPLVPFRDYYGCKMAGFSIPAAEHRYVYLLT